MNNTTKISLTIELEGSTLVRKNEPEIIKYSVTTKDLKSNKKHKGKNDLKVVKEGTVKHYPLISKPAFYHISIGRESYDYMISKECPSWFRNIKAWKNMTETQRLEEHLHRLCVSKRGKSFSYVILKD